MRGEGAHSDAALIDGFLPAVRGHLIKAYGWFLLSLTGVEEPVTAVCPRSTQELPAPEAGKALSPEIAEFAQLENSGWLAQMLSDDDDQNHAHDAKDMSPKPAQGLLVSDREPPGFPVALAWADALTAIMTRMDDSLSEC